MVERWWGPGSAGLRRRALGGQQKPGSAVSRPSAAEGGGRQPLLASLVGGARATELDG